MYFHVLFFNSSRSNQFFRSFFLYTKLSTEVAHDGILIVTWSYNYITYMTVVVGDVYEDIFLFKKYEKIWNFSSFLFW